MQLSCHSYRITLTMNESSIPKCRIIDGICRTCPNVRHDKVSVSWGVAQLCKLEFLMMLYVINEIKLKHKSCVIYNKSYLYSIVHMELCLDKHNYRIGRMSTLRYIEEWNTKNDKGDNIDTKRCRYPIRSKGHESEDIFVSGEKFLGELEVFCATSAGLEIGAFRDGCQGLVPKII